MPLGDPKPGIITPPLTGGRGGTVMWLPSTPIRKAVVGLEEPMQLPLVVPPNPLAGAVQTERSPKPIPSAGVRTSPTPFFRSNERDQPPRSTVFLFPITFPRRPCPKDGFQAKARRGPKFV